MTKASNKVDLHPDVVIERLKKENKDLQLIAGRWQSRFMAASVCIRSLEKLFLLGEVSLSDKHFGQAGKILAQYREALTRLVHE